MVLRLKMTYININMNETFKPIWQYCLLALILTLPEFLCQLGVAAIFYCVARGQGDGCSVLLGVSGASTTVLFDRYGWFMFTFCAFKYMCLIGRGSSQLIIVLT